MRFNLNYFRFAGFVLAFGYCVSFGFGQSASADGKSAEAHDIGIYGVKIGMDVPTALRAVFENAKREPGQEKPDAMQKEGKDKSDIRVVYNDLPLGELQLVFDGGKFVREVILTYKDRPSLNDFRLPSSSDIGTASSGIRYDDRYTIGFVDSKKQEKLWWRDVNEVDSYKTRVSFRSGNVLKDGQLWWQTIVQKTVTVKPGDENAFRKLAGN